MARVAPAVLFDTDRTVCHHARPMPEKLLRTVHVRLSDEQAAELRDYLKWMQGQVPGTSFTEAEAARSLMRRGVDAWKAEKRAGKKRVSGGLS